MSRIYAFDLIKIMRDELSLEKGQFDTNCRNISSNVSKLVGKREYF